MCNFNFSHRFVVTLNYVEFRESATRDRARFSRASFAPTLRHESFRAFNAVLNMTMSCSESEFVPGPIVNYIFLHSIAAACITDGCNFCMRRFIYDPDSRGRRLYDLSARRTRERKGESPTSTAIKMLPFLRLINTYLHPATFFILPPPRPTHSFLYLTIVSCKELKLNVTIARESLVFDKKIHDMEKNN